MRHLKLELVASSECYGGDVIQRNVVPCIIRRKIRGGGIHGPYLKIGKSVLIVAICGLNSTFRMQFLKVSRRKNRSVVILENLHCPEKALVMHLVMHGTNDISDKKREKKREKVAICDRITLLDIQEMNEVDGNCYKYLGLLEVD